MIDILDEISELVYVTDIETYDLLYMNQSGKDMFKIAKLKGLKCYEVLHGETKPCEFCVNAKLKENTDYTWEHYNKVLHTHFRLKDRLINYNGVKAHLEIAFNINDQMETRKTLQTSVDEKQFLMECMKLLYDAKDINIGLQSVLEVINKYLQAKKTVLVQADGQGGFSSMTCLPGQPVDIRNIKQDSVDKEWEAILKDNEVTILQSLNDVTLEQASFLKNLGIYNLISLKMMDENGYDGFLIVENSQDMKLATIENDFKALQYFLKLAIKRSQDHKLLVQLSFYDMLTHIGNRNLYMKDLVSLLGVSYPIGVVYIDMNGLKDINDKLGHKQGDMALIECANAMKSMFSMIADTGFYRVGGDEFIIIAKDINELDFQSHVKELRKHFRLHTDFKVAIGSSWSNKASYITDLVSEADHKMYEDKKDYYRKPKASQRYRHYNDEILELTQPETLSKRISSDVFNVYLQPKFSFKDKALIGAEALIRYHSIDGVMQSPAQFLPLLEDSNLISHIDFYVFECMCSKLAEWKKANKKLVPISTNFSRYTLSKKDLIKNMVAITDRYGVDHRLLEIEITETVEGMEWFDMTTLVKDLNDAGFHVSIDDFGSHYANLSLFSSIDFSVLKIDKSLVDNIVENKKAQSVIKSIVEICRNMDIRVIVEGVETQEQFDVLKQLGCEGVQGFLFSKPLPLEIFEASYLA